MNAWKIISLVGILAAVVALAPSVATAITIDGVADTDYGSAISTQALGTTAFDNNISTNSGLANGSELDAAYGIVSNGALYLTMAGNFDSGFGFVPYDTLHVFFMADSGGTGNVLPTFADGGFDNRRTNMTGLIFDTGFNPNYWIYVNTGQNDTNTAPVTTYADYVVVSSNGTSAFLGNVNPPGVITNIYFGSIVQIALDNSNTNGVDANPCDTNAANTAAQSVAASQVRSGIEMAIPLTQLGLLSSATGTIRVCAFITEQTMSFLYNQSLGAFNGGSGYCLTTLDGFTTPTAGFDFNSYPGGPHYFTITVPPCEVLKINPTSAAYSSTGGVGSVAVANSGGCAITVTASTNWLTITSSGGLASGNGSFTYSVAPNTNSIQTRTADFIIRNTAPSGNIVTQLVTITETGVPSPPLSSTFTVDGTAEAAYGCPIAVQQMGTGFGNASMNSFSDSNGSELDAAYGIILNDVLFLVFAGNLESNGNKLDVFLQTGPGGQNTLTNVNPNIAGLNRMGYLGSGANPANPGLTFDAGFAPNYCIIINDYAGTCYVDYAQLWPSGTNALGVATNGYFLGASTPTNYTLIAGTNPFGIQVAINNSNTNGVDDTACTTNLLGAAQSIAAGSVRTGIELAIPLAAIGSPTGAIAVCAFINGGDQSFLSNQILGPIGANDCWGNLAESTSVNFTNVPGDQSFLVGPEMRITGIQAVATNIVISFQTAANSNLLYRVQRTSPITNAAWLSASPLTNGTGGITTLTIPPSQGSTNRPAQFYRVQQSTLCP